MSPTPENLTTTKPAARGWTPQRRARFDATVQARRSNSPAAPDKTPRKPPMSGDSAPKRRRATKAPAAPLPYSILVAMVKSQAERIAKLEEFIGIGI